MRKKAMTYDEFYELADTLSESSLQAGDYCPTMQEINDYVVPNPDPFITFLLWLQETMDEPEDDEEREVHKKINKILKENINLREP